MKNHAALGAFGADPRVAQVMAIIEAEKRAAEKRRGVKKPAANAVFGIDGLFVRQAAKRDAGNRLWDATSQSVDELNADESLHLQNFCEVEARGLKGAVELNGQRGFVCAFSAKESRYGVKFFETGDIKLLKRSNLTVINECHNPARADGDEEVAARVYAEVVRPFQRSVQEQLRAVLDADGRHKADSLSYAIKECGYGYETAALTDGRTGCFGAFATRRIKKGELVMVEWGPDRTLLSDSRRTNHSCSPNTIKSDCLVPGYHVKIALADIEEGQEITWDYESDVEHGKVLAFETTVARDTMLKGRPDFPTSGCACDACRKVGAEVIADDRDRESLSALSLLCADSAIAVANVFDFCARQPLRKIETAIEFLEELVEKMIRVCITPAILAQAYRWLAVLRVCAGGSQSDWEPLVDCLRNMYFYGMICDDLTCAGDTRDLRLGKADAHECAFIKCLLQTAQTAVDESAGRAENRPDRAGKPKGKFNQMLQQKFDQFCAMADGECHSEEGGSSSQDDAEDDNFDWSAFKTNDYSNFVPDKQKKRDYQKWQKRVAAMTPTERDYYERHCKWFDRKCKDGTLTPMYISMCNPHLTDPTVALEGEEVNFKDFAEHLDEDGMDPDSPGAMPLPPGYAEYMGQALQAELAKLAMGGASAADAPEGGRRKKK